MIRTLNVQSDCRRLGRGGLTGVIARVARLNVEQFQAANLRGAVPFDGEIVVLAHRFDIINQISVVIPVGLLD